MNMLALENPMVMDIPEPEPTPIPVILHFSLELTLRDIYNTADHIDGIRQRLTIHEQCRDTDGCDLCIAAKMLAKAADIIEDASCLIDKFKREGAYE